MTSISDMNSQIARAAEEQCALVESINHSVVKIRDVGVQTTAGSRQISQAATQLAKLAQDLQACIAYFIIRG